MNPQPLRGVSPPHAERPAARRPALRLRADSLAISEMPPPSWAADQYRAIALQVSERLDGSAAPCVLIVTSPEQGSGKTLTALNLALSLADTVDRKVVLVEGDLHRPTLHSYFEAGHHGPGFRQLLAGTADVATVALPALGTGLDVVLAGDGQGEAESLTPPRLVRCLAAVRARYGLVVVDSPPAPLLPSARALLAQADLAVVVVRVGRTVERDIEAVVELVGRERLLGVVLNGTRQRKGAHGYYYD